MYLAVGFLLGFLVPFASQGDTVEASRHLRDVGGSGAARAWWRGFSGEMIKITVRLRPVEGGGGGASGA